MRRAPGRGHPGEQQRERQREPDDAEVGERLHDVAVGVPDVERLRAVAQARRRVAFRAGAERRVRLEDLQRLVPVARAHAADRRQAARACWTAPARAGR